MQAVAASTRLREGLRTLATTCTSPLATESMDAMLCVDCTDTSSEVSSAGAVGRKVEQVQ
jgi:hypothetical protein